MKDVKDDTDEMVKAMRTRLGELEAQLELMRLRLTTVERTLAAVVELDGDAFRDAARAAYDRLNEGQRGFVGVVAIADLRRALGARVSRAAFDTQLTRLHDEGIIQLMANPGTRREGQQKDALVHPTDGAFHYLRWERRS